MTIIGHRSAKAAGVGVSTERAWQVRRADTGRLQRDNVPRSSLHDSVLLTPVPNSHKLI